MLTSLASSNPQLALVLQTIRLRVLLRQHMAAGSLKPTMPGRPKDAIQYESELLRILAWLGDPILSTKGGMLL